jgi:hypothetical protein
MATRLVTIATFDHPMKARLSHNALTEAGIQAVMNDESLVAMDWLLSNAVGGIKLQVREEDTERAVAALEQAFGANGEGFGSVDPAELASQAEAAMPDEPGESDFSTRKEPDSNPSALPAIGDGPTEPASERDEYARRAFFAGWVGILVPLVPFYAIYLILNVLFGSGPLSRRGRFQLIIGGTMCVLSLTLEFIWFGQVFWNWY